MEEIAHIEHYNYEKFSNWGDNVKNTPLITFIPRSINQVVEVIQWARKYGKRVRCSGTRHTWNNMYSDDNEILLAMIPFEQSEIPPSSPVSDAYNDLRNIHMVTIPTKNKKGLVRVGVAVNNLEFKNWLIANKVSIDSNVIMTEVTVGGVNAPICHGSGISTETMSDITHAIDLVDYNGKIRYFNRNDDEEIMKAAGGAFGLFGIVTAVTLEINTESFAVMLPENPKLELGIPRSREDHPKEFEKFEKQILENYYNEYFWFPCSEFLWINCWKNNGNKSEAIDYPSPTMIKIHEFFGALGETMQNTLFKCLSPKMQCKLFSTAAMVTLPANEKFTTHIMNAIHFRGGIHHMRVRDYELEFPIPPNLNSQKLDITAQIPNLEFVSSLWWAAIDLIKKYESRNQYPTRIALEMRIMGGSSRTLMAPQKGNKWTCAIEVLTSMNVPVDEWNSFINNLVNVWMSIPKVAQLMKEGKFPRTHWAKGWENTILDGDPIQTKLKEIYKDEISEFNLLRKQAKVDENNMFSNNLLDDLFDLKFMPDNIEKL